MNRISWEQVQKRKRLLCTVRLAGWFVFWFGIALAIVFSSERGVVLSPFIYGSIVLAVVLCAAGILERGVDSTA